MSEVDENLPILGAIAGSPPPAAAEAVTLANSKVVLAVHVRSGPRMLDILTKGGAARFTSSLDPATSIAKLSPKSGGDTGISIGILGNYIIIANNSEALTSVGPYAVRTMPSSEIPKDDIAVHLTEKALSEWLTPALYERAQSKSQDSALGELFTAVFFPKRALEKLKEIAPDLKDPRITLSIGDHTARLRLHALPKTPSGPASAALSKMSAGPPTSLMELPSDTIIGIIDHDAGEARAENAASYADTMIQALGGPEKLPEADRAAITAAWTSISEARGAFTTMGLAFGPTGPVGYARMPAPDEQKLSKALRQFTGLLKRKAIKEALSALNLKVTSKKTVIENIEGDAERVRFERIPPESPKAEAAAKKAKGSPEKLKEQKSKDGAVGNLSGDVPLTIDFYWLIRGGTLYAAAGYESKAGLSSVMEAGRKNDWGGLPELRNSIESIGNEVSFALAVDPLRFVASRAGKPGAAPPAPIVLAIGKSGESKESMGYSMELYMSGTAIQELVKHRGALMPKK